MDYIIRAITERDEIFETGRIYIDCIRHDYDFKPAPYLKALNLKDEIQECLEWLEVDPNVNKMFGAYLDDKLIGYIATGSTSIDDEVKFGEITGFFIQKVYRGQGHGLRLLHTAISFLKDKGFQKTVVYNYHRSTSNTYYRMLGGKVIHREIQNPGGMSLETDVFVYEADSLINILDEKLKKYE